MNNNSLENNVLINTLNTMYNNNSRHINLLIDSNNNIINIISDLLNYRQPNQNRQQSNQNRQQSNQNRQNRQTDINRLNRQTDINRLNRVLSNPYIDNTNIFARYLNDLPINNQTVRPTHETMRINNAFNTFLEPIIVYPTQTQIEYATRIVRYGDIISPMNNSCPISLDTFNEDDAVSIIRYCGHIFNTVSLNTWFRTNCKCPVCRYDIREYNNSRNPQTQQVISTTPTTTSPPEGESYNNDLSGNLIRAMTDILLNELMNPTSDNRMNFNVDPSNNYIESTMYLTFPTTRWL